MVMRRRADALAEKVVVARRPGLFDKWIIVPADAADASAAAPSAGPDQTNKQ
jgi:hypothetical protein